MAVDTGPGDGRARRPATGRTAIRLGVNLLCLTDRVGLEHEADLRRMRAIGFDGVEVPVLTGEPAGYARLGALLDAIGLGRTATAIVPSPDADPTSADAAVRARGEAHLAWALDCAAALGAESLGGPIHAPLGHFPGRGPTDEELGRLADAHRRLAEAAQARKMFLSVEPLNRFETHVLNTSIQARAHCERVDHPGCRIMFDTFHANIEEADPVAAVARLAGRHGVFHASENDRGIPGRGHVDFAAHLGALKGTGWDGWLVMEAFGSGLPGIAAATRVWRPLFPDLDTLWREGHDFLRRTWEAA